MVGSGAEEAAARAGRRATGPGGPTAEPGRPAARWAAAWPRCSSDVPLVVLPASPDGRDLAPRLAAVLDRPLLAGAVGVAPATDGTGPGRPAPGRRPGGGAGRRVDGPVVATLLPGVRGVGRHRAGRRTAAALAGIDLARPRGDAGPDAELVELVLEPDPATMDLADATRVLGGGAGLVARGAGDRRPERVFALLDAVAAAPGCVGGRHPGGHRRRLGRATSARSARPASRSTPTSTSPSASPGAIQHIGGLGDPRAHRQRQHRPVLPDDGHGRPRPRHRRRRPARCELAGRLGVGVPAERRQRRSVTAVADRRARRA